MFRQLFKPTLLFNKLYQDKDTCMSIKPRMYNKLLRKLNSLTIPTEYPYVSMYQYFDEGNSLFVFHITDEQLSRVIYSSLQRNINSKLPISGLSFVTIDSDEKAVFAVCSRSGYSLSHYVPYLAEIVDSFIEYFSTENSKIHINYRELIRLFSEHNSLHTCMLASITLNPIEATDEDFEYVIDKSIGYLTTTTLKDIMKETFRPYPSFDFYYWLRKGVFVREKSSCISDSIFTGLLVNILRYLLDNSTFSDLSELFRYESVLEQSDNLTDIYIINEEKFNYFTALKAENEDFLTLSCGTNNTFIKLKNTEQTANLESVIQKLKSLNLLDYTSIVRSLNNEIYLLCKEPNGLRTLKQYVRDCYYETNFANFLITIYDTFSNLSDIEDIRFRSDAILADCILFDGDEFTFCELDKLSINKDEPCITFNYSLVMLQVIREYTQVHAIKIENIYNCEFMKLLPPAFANRVIEYLSTGNCETNDLQDLLQGILKIEHLEHVIFIDKILSNKFNNVKGFLSSISFFEDYNLNNDLVEALKRDNHYIETPTHKDFLSLDKFLTCITSRSLSNANLDSILKFANRTDVFAPKNVIVSRDTNDDGTYKIIGVQWNECGLYNLTDVITSDKTNVKSFYLIIAEFLRLYFEENIDVIKLLNTQDGWLVNNREWSKTDLLINSTVLDDYRIKSRTNELSEYYSQIIHTLGQLVDLSQYPIYNFNSFLIRSDYSETSKLTDFIKSAKGIEKCDEHGNWFMHDTDCPTCKLIYHTTDSISSVVNVLDQPSYEDNVSRFYSSSNKNSFCTIKGSSDHSDTKYYHKQVKLGIEHKLFDIFKGPKPLKIVRVKDERELLIVPYLEKGILCQKYNFSSFVSLYNFKQVQRLKAILALYENILPHILNKNFISTDPEIFKTLVMSKQFKGMIFIPNMWLLECSSIISEDSKLKETRADMTKKVFSDFLISYIMDDEFLANQIKKKSSKFVAIIDDIKNCLFTEDVIASCLNLYSRHCLTHKVSFSNHEQLCPECLNDGINDSNIEIKDRSYFDNLNAKKSQYDGGEANLYPYSDNEVQKIFKSTVDISFKSKILAKALQKKPLIEEFNRKHPDIKIISANKLLYMFENNVLQLKGFTQQFIDGSYKLSSLKSKDFVKEQEYTRKDVVEILIKICKGIEFLHSIGGFIGDLNGGNILIKGKNVYIIDIDGMSFDEVKNCMYTLKYIYPPSADSNNITMDDDWYSLAVQAFYYLTFSHPFNGLCDNRAIPDNEVDRMRQKTSVIGNHGIVPPTISIGWNFLPDYLLKYFLNTFEGSKRESMLEELCSYLSHLEKNEPTFTEIKRTRDVDLNISEHTYIDTDSNLIYKENLVLSKLSDNRVVYHFESHTLILCELNSFLFDETSGKLITFNKKYYPTSIDVCNNKIYYTSSDGRRLYVDEKVDGTDDIKSREIKKVTTNEIVALSVYEDDKFVFVENNADRNSYDIFCNAALVKSIDKEELKDTTNVRFSILYDSLYKNWLVFFTNSELSLGTVIGREGSIGSTFTLDAISKYKEFFGNCLYYSSSDKIHCYSLSKRKTKDIICYVADENSRVKRKDNKFIVINNDSIYEYTKS